MLEVYERLGTHCHEPVDEIVKLDSDQRDRGRLRLKSENEVEVRLFLERGNALQVGEFLKSECGKIVQVQGAVETVAHASSEDWHSFARACYHLGNRHTRIEIGERWLRFSPDHVLEEMVHMLGLEVTHEDVVFAPENGAYFKGEHSHGHSHSHNHEPHNKGHDH